MSTMSGSRKLSQNPEMKGTQLSLLEAPEEFCCGLCRSAAWVRILIPVVLLPPSNRTGKGASFKGSPFRLREPLLCLARARDRFIVISIRVWT